MASRTCATCGRRVRTVVPAGGDGSGQVFVRHKHGSKQCSGSRTLAPNHDDEEISDGE